MLIKGMKTAIIIVVILKEHPFFENYKKSEKKGRASFDDTLFFLDY